MAKMSSTSSVAESREIDLTTGTERNPVTEEVIRHIALWAPTRSEQLGQAKINHWKERVILLSTELFLASQLAPTQGLSLFDMILIWPCWLEKAYFFKDLRRMFGAPACLITRALLPYGWAVELIGITRWALRVPKDWTGAACPISAAKAIGPLKEALTAFAEKNHGTALLNARKALNLSRGSHDAKLISAGCIFEFGERVEPEFAEEMAEYALEYEKRLRSAIDGISILWKREQGRKPAKWLHALEHRDRFGIFLDYYKETFDGARKLLYGNDHGHIS